jgi:hypothetical protein
MGRRKFSVVGQRAKSILTIISSPPMLVNSDVVPAYLLSLESLVNV